MAAICFISLVLPLLPVTEGFLVYNPADLSTALGYQNHKVHDLTSLVNEASGVAHGTGSGQSSAAGPYNVPNFPAMGQNPVQPQTGSLGSASGSGSAVSSQTGNGGTPFSVSNGGGSASFAGTNQWRCDAHVVESCDTQCLDVDPKDGCPFCIPGCNPNSGGTSSSGAQGSQSVNKPQGQGTVGSQSGGLSQNPGTLSGGTIQSGGLSQNPGTLSGGTSQSGGLSQNPGTLSGGTSQSVGLSQNAGSLSGGTSQSGGLSQSPGLLSGGSSQSGSLGQSAGTLSGTAAHSSTGLGGNLVQQPSGLAGTGGKTQGTQSSQGTSGPSITTSGSNTAACPHFPSNCPKIYTALDKNGCLVCTILSQISTIAPAPTTTLPPTSRTCAPKRCVAPCNKGIVLDSDGCPHCVCPAHI